MLELLYECRTSCMDRLSKYDTSLEEAENLKPRAKITMCNIWYLTSKNFAKEKMEGKSYRKEWLTLQVYWIPTCLKPLAERKLLFCDQHSVGSHVEELLSSLSSQFNFWCYCVLIFSCYMPVSLKGIHNCGMALSECPLLMYRHCLPFFWFTLK